MAACGPNLPVGLYYAVSRFQIIHKHPVGAYDVSDRRIARSAKWYCDGRCF